MNPIIPKTNSAPGAGAPASLYLGELASNRTTGKLYLGCDSGVVEIQGGGGGGTTGSQISTFTGTGSQTAFAPLTGYSNTTVGNYLVSVGGIDQRPTTDWTISSANSGTITFASAPPNGAPIVVRAFVGASGGGGGSGDATSLQGRPLANTAPTDGQAVVWDDANETWKPGTVDRFIRGAWNNSTTYAVGDVVSHLSQLYVCTLESVGWPPVDWSTSDYWRQINGNAILLQNRYVSSDAPQDAYALCWNAAYAKWEPQAQQRDAQLLQNRHVSSDAPQDAYALCWNAAYAKWEPQAQQRDAQSFNGRAITSATPTEGDAYLWNDSQREWNLVNIKAKINEIITWANTAGASISPL